MPNPKRKPGRPRLAKPGQVVRLVVTVPQPYRDIAKRLGDGNISAGVRIALERADK